LNAEKGNQASPLVRPAEHPHQLKISHEELSEMVGTTRPRISLFMQRFRNLGLMETDAEHFLIIKEKKFTAYLAQIA
jgi:CRP/FNR family transcriptional regulator, cyclic AMP receptor protein